MYFHENMIHTENLIFSVRAYFHATILQLGNYTEGLGGLEGASEDE